nr:retrovirus-related Pol polyprotein from transposon TNT 1-94 [Tanacetum cinerariifolium]
IKDETTTILKKFITEIENLVDKKVKVIRCDNGKEFKNSVMNDFCAIKGIRRGFSVARTPQQNGIAERRNRTLIEAARTMALVVKPHTKTPYELFRGRTPTLSFMRPFGCHVTILNTLNHLGKFDEKADEGFFVGYSMNSKAFRVYNISTRRLEENLHIEFLENKSIVAGTNSNDFAGTKDSIGAVQSSMETGSTQDYIFMPLWKDGSSLFDSSPKIPDDAGSPSFGDVDDPKMPGLETIETYDDTTEEADFTNLESSNFVSPTPTSRIHKNHPLKQVIGSLNTTVQTKSKLKPTNEQGFINGYTQEEGIDYDECFAPVARIEAIRLFLAYALFMGFMVYQMDVKSAFLYERIKEEVYVCQPPGFEDPNHPDKVLRKFNFSDVKFASTPVDMEKTLVKDANGDNVDVHLYRSMIGSLMYLTASRPDIIDSLFELVAYADSDYAGANLDRKSTTGVVIS